MAAGEGEEPRYAGCGAAATFRWLGRTTRQSLPEPRPSAMPRRRPIRNKLLLCGLLAGVAVTALFASSLVGGVVVSPAGAGAVKPSRRDAPGQ